MGEDEVEARARAADEKEGDSNGRVSAAGRGRDRWQMRLQSAEHEQRLDLLLGGLGALARQTLSLNGELRHQALHRVHRALLLEAGGSQRRYASHQRVRHPHRVRRRKRRDAQAYV